MELDRRAVDTVRRRAWRVFATTGLALAVAGCGAPSASPSGPVEAGILIVAVGEEIQARPPNETVAQAWSDAMMLAERNGDDLGYPWVDPSSGQLVLSAVSARGRALIEAAGITVPHRVRDVTHGAAELARILDEATMLRSRGIPGAELVFATLPDHRDNRALIVIRAASEPLLEYLAGHYPVDAVAIEVAPNGT